MVGLAEEDDPEVGCPDALSAGIVVVDAVLLLSAEVALSLAFFAVRLGGRLACKTAS